MRVIIRIKILLISSRGRSHTFECARTTGTTSAVVVIVAETVVGIGAETVVGIAGAIVAVIVISVTGERDYRIRCYYDSVLTPRPFLRPLQISFPFILSATSVPRQPNVFAATLPVAL